MQKALTVEYMDRNSNNRQAKTLIDSSTDPNVASPVIVLKPKLQAPAPRPEQLVRHRLLKLLGEALHHKATLISAPAGYGKTTLLVQWRQVEESSLPFAWVSLDEQDNDPVRLWRHVLEALREAVPDEDFGADVLVSLTAARQNLVEAPLPFLINELAELPSQIVLVLDDYQLITEDRCHESMAFFVEHLPTNVHLVISSRSDPPLPLGRLRARAEMDEIRAEQLAFSEEEAARLLNEKMGLNIAPDDLSVLFERAEGWPAAIYLASLSLRNREDKHAFIESFGGSNRYIVALLLEEVMAGLPEEVKEFLLRTSVLMRMTGALCDAVAGREGSDNLLRELARSNLLVVPLDERGEWYRYHHLFTDLLLYELRSARPELVRVLHERASAWLEGERYLDSAIRHAIAATDYERAGILIARHWFRYMVVGETVTIVRWLESLPEELTTRDAALVLVRAWMCALYGRREEAESLLALAEGIAHEGPLTDGTASVEASVAILRASFGYGGVQSSVEAARRAAVLEPELTSPRAALIRFGLGASLYISEDTSQARKSLEEALELTSDGQPLVRMVSLSFLAFVAVDEGRLEETESLARELRALVNRFRLQELPQGTVARTALGRVLAERGELEEAKEELEGALSARRGLHGLSPWPTLLGLLALSQVHLASGDRAAGRKVLAEARAILEPFGEDTGILSGLLERQENRLRARKARQAQLDDELTEREMVVLGLLDGELTVRQIAQSLHVAPDTVKTQIKSIYRKLGVSSREQAVEEARRRELL
jgi:LuxR family maltose regulon positive regulatory protein